MTFIIWDKCACWSLINLTAVSSEIKNMRSGGLKQPWHDHFTWFLQYALMRKTHDTKPQDQMCCHAAFLNIRWHHYWSTSSHLLIVTLTISTSLLTLFLLSQLFFPFFSPILNFTVSQQGVEVNVAPESYSMVQSEMLKIIHDQFSLDPLKDPDIGFGASVPGWKTLQGNKHYQGPSFPQYLLLISVLLFTWTLAPLSYVLCQSALHFCGLIHRALF